MEGYEKVVIVDAMTGIGDRMGEVVVFEALPTPGTPVCALHDLGVGEVVTLARELGYPTEIVTVGIEAGAIQAFSREIDPAVLEGIPVAEEEIRKVLQGWGCGAGGAPGDV
jgi:hydrogenase maturation protease